MKKKVIAHGGFIWAVVYRFLVNILVSSLTLHLNPQCPYSLTVEEILKKCPVFGKGVCPYKALADEMKGIAGNCPGFKHGCPFKNLKTMGEYVGKLAEMRDKTATPKGRAAFEKLMKRVHEISRRLRRRLDLGHSLQIPAQSLLVMHMESASCQNAIRLPQKGRRIWLGQLAFK